MDLRYQMWWWRRKKFPRIVVGLKTPRSHVSVMSAHRLGIMADQFHNDAFGNSGIFQETDCGLSERVKPETVRRAPVFPPFALTAVRSFLTQSDPWQNVRNWLDKFPDRP